MEKQIEEIRRFSRFYTGLMNGWERVFHGNGYTMKEIRTLLEIRQAGVCSLRELASLLNTGKGQMSRLTVKLQQEGLIRIKVEEKDRRFSQISLTEKGKADALKFRGLYDAAIARELKEKTEKQQQQLIEHLKEVKRIYENS